MNNIEKYFSSPEKNGNNSLKTPSESASLECKKVKDPKGTNKLIVSNMEEVISSVKKKDKQKHQNRRKKDKSRKSESEMADISNKLTNSLSIISPNVSVDEVISKPPLKESKTKNKVAKRKSNDIKCDKKQKSNSEQDATVVDLRSPQRNSSIRDHFSSKSKKSSEEIVDSKEINGGSAPKVNAFQLLMSGRNKVIGSNIAGKDNLEKEEEIGKCDTDNKKISAKRKLLLEAWADKKGAVKRKAEDEARGEYIDKQMNERAKRLKTMLTTTKKEIIKNDEIKDSKAKRGRPRKIDTVEPIAPEDDELIVISSQSTTKSSKSKAKQKKPPKTSKARSRRLSSYDSNISLEDTNQDEEFLATLSSPIKKRDSLLGYFPKIPSPTEHPNKGENSQSSKRSKSESKVSKTKSQNFDSASLEIYSTPPSTTMEDNKIGSCRPRRSCAGKARYDYDLEKSPKLERTKTTRRSSKNEDTANGLDINKDIIIDLDNSMENSFGDGLTPRKLAPVFIKALPKPTLDPAAVKARYDFLMSGVPEKMRLDMEKQKQYEQAFEAAVEIFPKISHVLQSENCNADSINVDWGQCGITWKQVNESPRRSIKQQKRKLNNLVSRTPRKKFIPLQELPELQNKREFVKHLKVLYDKFPTFRCYNQLRQKYRHFCAKDTETDTQQIAESFVVTKTRRVRQRPSSIDSDKDVKPPPSAPNGELLFTEKYKPQSFEEILVNLNPVRFVKEFLATFQNTRIDENGSSDFELTTDSSTGHNPAAFNSVVLLGPNSSGKTNAVFALANDMNFNVLEINAGIKRTGKKILQELHEATQSHQVSKDRNKLNPLRNSLNAIKKKYQDQAESSSSSDLSGTAKLSLILVEDADVVFEQDAGFVEAIYQLVASSKRPVIITASNANCPHLYKLINQNSIEFSRPNALNISKFLSILSLIENCPINIDDIVSLYLYNQCNLRKTLLEMQFFIQSGGDRIRQKKTTSQYFASSPRKQSLEELDHQDVDIENDDPKSNGSWNKTYVHKTLFQFYTICQNIDRRIPYPVDFDILRVNMSDIFSVSKCGRAICSKKKLRRKTKSPVKSVRKEVDESLRNISDFYENISIAANIDPVKSCDRLRPNLSEDISHVLVEEALKINLQAENVAYNLFDDPKERISLTSYMPTNILKTNRSLFLEYEPCLRSICRSEKIRSGEERRGSRFYHYLRNTCSNINSFSTQVFDNACLILNDDINPNITIPSEEGGHG